MPRSARRFAVAVALALVPAAVFAAEPADLPGAAWRTLVQQLSADRPRVVEPIWGPGSVEFTHDSRQLRVTLAADVVVGVAGAVDVALVAAGGTVREVTFGGQPGDWLIGGGMVLVRLEATASRRGRVTIVSEWPLDPDSAQAAVVPLPPWPRATWRC